MSAQPALRAPSSPWRSTYEKAQRAAEKRQVAADEGAADEGAGTGGGGGAVGPSRQRRKIWGPEGAKGATPRAFQRAFA
jgi:hypothetical protein